MALDPQEPGDYHSHQKPAYIPVQSIGLQELYNWKPPTRQKEYTKLDDKI